MLTSETISTFLAGQKAVLLLTLIVNIWGLVALYRNARNRPSDFGLAFMLLGLLGWTGSILALLLFATLPAAHIAFFSTTMALTGFAWFALVYPSETYKKYHLLALVPGTIVGILALIPNFFINGLSIDAHGYLSLIRNQTLTWFSIYVIIAGTLPTYLLFRKKFTEQNVQMRQRLHWIATASLITFTGSFVTNVLLPNFFDFPYLNSIGPAFSMMLAMIIVWMTSTEHYVDSKNVFGIITGRLALAAATIIVFSSISMLLALGSTESVIINIVAASATALIIFVLGPWIRNAGESLLQQKERRQLAAHGNTRGLFDALAPTTTVGEIISILGKKFDEIATVEILLASRASPEIATHVAALAEIRTCTLNPPTTYLIDALSVTMPHEADPHRIAVSALATALAARVIVPITHHQQIIGILALGRKKNGSGYTKHDAITLASTARMLSPLLIRASIIEQADETARTLEENVALRTHAIKRTQEDERDVAYRLALMITQPIDELRESTILTKENFETDMVKIGKTLDVVSQAAQALLAFTRAKSAPFTPSRTFNLSTMIRELVTSSQAIASDADVELRYELTDNILIRGNATSIQNTLAAIIGNAFNYLGATNRAVHISLSANASQAIISVSDTGIGFPGDVIDRIGTPFFNAHPRREVEQGLGLNLSIARGIILQHGGTIVVTSLHEKGTTVRIALPLSKEEN